jgi:Phytochelatin synthase
VAPTTGEDLVNRRDLYIFLGLEFIAVVWAGAVFSLVSTRLLAYQNDALLARAWALPVARLYGPQGYLFQQNPSTCGPTSIADLLRSEGRPADPSSVLNGSGVLVIFGLLPGGLTLDQEAKILTRSSGKSVKLLRDLSLDSFRAEMAKSNDPSRRVVINFSRKPLFGRGYGHFSPILGYLPAEDLVFVGDVNANYRPWLVPTTRLYDAQNTIDSSSRAKRGLLEIDTP